MTPSTGRPVDLGHFYYANFFNAFLEELGNFKPFEVNFKKNSTGHPVDDFHAHRSSRKIALLDVQ